MSFQRPFLLSLRRQDNRQPWGFRLHGGANYNQPLTVQKVTPNGLGERSGLREGDEMIQIGRVNVQDMTLEEVQGVLANVGSRLEVFVIREDLLRNRKENEPTTLKAVVHAQYNSPLNLYSTENIADTLAQQAHILTDGEVGYDYNSGPTSPVVLHSKVLQVVKEEEYKEPQYPSPVSPSGSRKPPPPLPPPKPQRSSPLSPPQRHQKLPGQRPVPKQETSYQNSTDPYTHQYYNQHASPASPVITQQQPSFNHHPTSPVQTPKQTPYYQQPVGPPSPKITQQKPSYYQQPVAPASPKITSQKPSFPNEVHTYGIKTAQPQYESYQHHTQQNYQQQHYQQTHYQQQQQRQQQQQPEPRIYQSQVTFQPKQKQQQQVRQVVEQPKQKTQQQNYQTTQQVVKTQHQQQQYSRPSPQSSSSQVYQTQQHQQQQQNYQQQQRDSQQKQQNYQQQQQREYQQQNYQQQQQGSQQQYPQQNHQIASHTPQPVSQVYQSQNTYQKEVQKHQKPYYGSSARMMNSSPNGSPSSQRRPIWPPKYSSIKELPKTGFSPNLVREDGSKKFIWPPPKDYVNDRSAPGSPTCAVMNAWHPTETTARSMAYASPVPSRRAKDVAWPPPHTQAEGKHKSLPRTVHRSSGRFEDYVSSNAGCGVPATYRTPPGTQHVEVIYE